jgi:hypothetical protein
MKKLLFLFTAITLFSCSKNEDDNSASTTSNIVGKWHLTSILEDGKPITGYTCNTDYDIDEFTSDGRVIAKYSKENSSKVCIQYTENSNYTISENILTDVEKKGDIKIYEAKYKIKELTATSLKLEEISEFYADDNGNNPMTATFAEGESVKIYNKIN